MEYWTIIDDRHAGPFSAEELVANGIGLDSPVWMSGLPDWVEARDIPELRALLEGAEAGIDSLSEGSAHSDIFIEETIIEEEIPINEGGEAPLQEEPYYENQQQFENRETPYFQQSQMPPQQPYCQQPQPQWEWQREPQPIPEGAEIPPSYLAWSIIVTVICCIPLGIPAIIFSAKTRQAISRGDLVGARKSSDTAQWCIILAIVLGLITMPLQIVFSGL